MAKHVNKVLVANTVGTAGSLAYGNLMFFSPANALTTTPTVTDKSFRAGIVLDTDGTVVNDAYLSDKVTRDMIEAVTFEDYQAPISASAVVTIGTVVAGNRYVLRISYNDVTEMPIQFTQSFDVVATDATAATLATQLAAAINSKTTTAGRHARVTASAASGVLTLTAKDITVDNTVSTPYQFHQVQLGAVSLYTKDTLGNSTSAATTIVLTAADKGNGYWKVVRDIEKDALGYRGQMFFKEYLMNKGTQLVEVGATYSCINILYNNNYRSADNQFVKSTPLALNIYIKGATVPSALKTAILAWVNGSSVAADSNTSTVA